MTTPSQSDENEPNASAAEPSGSASGNGRPSPGPTAGRGLDAETMTTSATTGGSGSGPSTGSAPTATGAGSTGTPPPWQRSGAASGPPQGGNGAGGSGGSGPGASGPGGGSGPTGPNTGSTPSRGPGPGGPSTGSTPAAGGGNRPTGGSGRGGTALIDAPTNQLSPEQLRMRGGAGRVRTDQAPVDDDPSLDDISAAKPSRSKAPRRASLQLKHFDPWSVLKLALVLGVALFFVWMFAVGVLYAVLDGMGVWAQLNGTYQDLTSQGGSSSQLITAGGVFGVAAIIGVVNAILFTALASVSAFIYNISADVAGGIEVTLSERD